MQREIHELIMLYELHPHMRDFYVEGPYDRAILTWFVREMGLKNAYIYDVDVVKISQKAVELYGAEGGKKGRVINLAREMVGKTPSPQNVTCIADKDGDEYLGRIVQNDILLYTDFSCMEAYFFDAPHFAKFITIIYGAVEVDVAALLPNLYNVLQQLFAIRVVKERHLELAIIPFRRCCELNGGTINFLRNVYIERMLIARGALNKLEGFVREVDELLAQLNGDKRNHIHGHDLVTLLAWYLREIGYRADWPLDRIIAVSADISSIQTFPLFQSVLARAR